MAVVEHKKELVRTRHEGLPTKVDEGQPRRRIHGLVTAEDVAANAETNKEFSEMRIQIERTFRQAREDAMEANRQHTAAAREATLKGLARSHRETSRDRAKQGKLTREEVAVLHAVSHRLQAQSDAQVAEIKEDPFLSHCEWAVVRR